MFITSYFLRLVRAGYVADVIHRIHKIRRERFIVRNANVHRPLLSQRHQSFASISTQPVVVAADTRLAEALALSRQAQPADEQTDGIHGAKFGLIQSGKRDRCPDRDGQELRSSHDSPDTRDVRGPVE